jgi:PKD repeat protein
VETAPKIDLVATPSSGTAPLVVTFSGHGSGRLEGVMQLAFGDRQVDNTIPTIRGFKRTHTYAAPGAYVAELRSGDYGGQKLAELSTVASVTITVR